MNKKIRLIVDVPVANEHGMTKGRELDVLRSGWDGTRGSSGDVWVMGDAGKEVKLHEHEYEWGE